MVDNMNAAPASAGVYLFRNAAGTIIYVGKAKNLKKRIASYAPKRPHDIKTTHLLEEVLGSVEYILTDNEIEALFLEARMIRKHRPKYNIDLKDSGSYPYIRVTLEDEFPRIYIVREIKNKKSLYLGPYTDVRSVRRALRIAIDIFGIRICRMMPTKKCLKKDTEKCSAPCVGAITKEEYLKRVERAVSFLRGNVDDVLPCLAQEMRAASDAGNYEAAKIYRDQIVATNALNVKQKMESKSEYDGDLIGFARAGKKYFVQIFNVRRGILLGRTRHEAVSESEPKKFLSEFIKQHYYTAPVPAGIFVGVEPLDTKSIGAYLFGLSGKKARIKVAKSGEKRKLIQLLLKNISHELELKYLPELVELKSLLSLDAVPVSIECFDVSNIQGSFVVGSMVRFQDGEADKAKYRKFRVRAVDGQDDVASIREIVLRRFSGTIRTQMSLPDLVVIDGGGAQLNAACSAMDEANVDIPVIALAKREEEIYVPCKIMPLRLNRKSGALKLLQRIRDEAHRFAVSYHRVLRGRSVL